ncbi:multidrug ABC transporter permease/ATP-binding protein [Lactiplantibacillus pentosus]|uniref:ABC transporter, ATP-binding and permease protein n=1 Tax=Lactiplantibacillus pentosus IG1 TaxID=1042160 RepID=G0M625_LACPE|nr:ABC transporter transmembrane domain-containing protein [Lactiplantibacillus pentosus]CCC17742.1 ABC transporter, ATP-binding and permease protein [Lactiplantibacillus pentosus IG1]MCT3283562.1 ATP-binding cassette domain-containing protein [Lactiplantibacillus pentosus]MCT3302313.1 ATP-binding cassette domain-containing protein [Lactiplantibacillus pentosus]PRO79154.1 multidrug ABC transporter permease/ATP-binding protein [Lactiplantibacillus pentosus]PRO81700.1 multidrug ABC transporter p
MSIFIKLGWYFRREWKLYSAGVLGLVLTAIIGIIPPRIIGDVVDGINQHHLTARSLMIYLGIIGAAAIGQYLARYLWRNAIWGGAAGLERTLRERLFWHFMKMDATFYQKYRTGDLMAHATNDLTAVERVAGGGILQFADSIITGGTTLIAMMTLIDWRLTLIAVVPFPLLAVVSRYLGKKIHVAFRASQAAFSRLNNKAQESISGIKVIKALGQEQADVADFNQQIDETIKINRHVNVLDSLFDPAITMIIALSYGATIILGGMYVTHGIITIGNLVSFVTYLGMMVWPMFAVGMLFNTMERGNASYDRVMELLNQQSAIVDAKRGIEQRPHGDIQYQITQFNYPNDAGTSLRDVNFKLKAGQTLGIVGRVGAGKSTIMKLILREFDQYDGQITYGGHDIKQYALDSYLPAIGYVPQDSFLFSNTIRENIRFADPSVSQDVVEAVAAKSDLNGQIANMPAGYDTQVGEEGISLSGGQRQRLAIARALLINPELLILDDALSAVDAETEAEILTNLKAERADKTTIIAAHRLSSVMNADEIIVLDAGRVVERGTHTQLMAQQGWYQQMFERQQLETKVEGAVQ